MNTLRRLHEWLHAKIYGDTQSHPSHGYDSKIERWREYPYQPAKHIGHERATTLAHYGNYRVCYCYDCNQHYRTLEDCL